MKNTIEIFPWNHNFETGINSIDVQHRRLVELLNLLVSHLTFESDVPAMDTVFEQLKEYTVFHFQTEEALWCDAFSGDPWEIEHKQAHSHFVEEVLRLKAEEEVKSFDDVIEDLVAFLTHWLALHIIDSDKRMAKVVLALQSGVAREEAKLIATEQMAGATRAMVETVMTMYDKLAARTVHLTREIGKRRVAELKLQKALDALKETSERADAANKAKSTFLANMSHEIRTPMNAITGMVHLLKQEGLSPKQSERIKKIDNASQHLLSVINDILDISKIEADKLVLEETSLNVGSVVKTVASMVEDRAEEKGLTIHVEAMVPHHNLIGDRTRLKQALLNYATNAVKFTESGSIILRATSTDESDEYVLVRFEVQDSGIGIDPEAQSRLFANFEQLNSSITRKYGGTGLGLSLTRKLALLMGGESGVHSTPGIGSTFWFTARLKKDAAAAAEHEVVTESAETILKRDFSGTSILLVEDNEINREIALDILVDAALAVDTAEDGLIAVELVQKNDYALILMDLQMPNLGGLEATQRIRLLPSYREIPIIAMTANAFVEDKTLCIEAGMNDFITKPVEPEVLYETLVRCLRISKMAL